MNQDEFDRWVESRRRARESAELQAGAGQLLILLILLILGIDKAADGDWVNAWPAFGAVLLYIALMVLFSRRA